MELQRMTDDATGADGAVESAEISEAVTDETSQATEDDGPKELQPETPDEESESEADDSEGEDEKDAVEMVEFDFGGNKKQYPKDSMSPELAEDFQAYAKAFEAGTNKKAQANAETAKTLATRTEAVEKLAGMNGEALQTYSRGLQLRTEIEQLSQQDMNAMWQANPDQARRVSDLLAQKQADFQSTIAKVGQQEQAFNEAQQAELVRRSDEGIATLDKRIANFSTEKAPEVVKYVVDTYGMPQSEADKWAVNPVVTEMAYKAMLYDRMQAKTAQPKPKPKQAKPVVAPKGSGKASGSSDPDKMSMSQLKKHLELAD